MGRRSESLWASRVNVVLRSIAMPEGMTAKTKSPRKQRRLAFGLWSGLSAAAKWAIIGSGP